MEQRTCNIIMCCKGHCNLVDEDAPYLDAVKAYMGKECDYPSDKYNESQITGILLYALYDFIDVCDKPSKILRELFYKNPFLPDKTLSECIVSSFRMIEVRNDKGYVNGFTDELLEQSKIDLS